MTETRAEVDGAVIREAAGRAVILWPEEPEFEPGTAWSSHTMTAVASGDPGVGTESGPPDPDPDS